MTGKELWEQYQHYTQDLTEHSRKLAFGGAAICWFFKSDKITFPPAIYWSLAFVVAFFICDVLHYLAGALVLRGWILAQEKMLWKAKKTIEGDFLKPTWVDIPAFTFFVLKSLFLITSFLCLGYEFYVRLKENH